VGGGSRVMDMGIPAVSQLGLKMTIAVMGSCRCQPKFHSKALFKVEDL
jgi:hypothetical protein